MPTRPGSRLDFLLEGPGKRCYVEVKNVTLVVDRIATFPDAVSERGTKHLKELIRLRRQGHRAVLLFVIQRRSCPSFRPADEIDPEYGRWLRRAVKAGVEVYPYGARVTTRAIVLKTRFPCTSEADGAAAGVPELVEGLRTNGKQVSKPFVLSVAKRSRRTRPGSRRFAPSRHQHRLCQSGEYSHEAPAAAVGFIERDIAQADHPARMPSGSGALEKCPAHTPVTSVTVRSGCVTVTSVFSKMPCESKRVGPKRSS